MRWSYRELGERVDAFAAGLVALGLRPGERIGIWSPNNAEWVVTQFATAKAGLILVNINPAYRLAELEYALNKVGCRALITATSFKTSDYIGMVNTLAPELRSAPPGRLNVGDAAGAGDGDPDRRRSRRREPFRSTASMAWRRLRIVRRLAELGPRLQFDDAINIQFTSGTTGAPKGATLTHHGMLNNGYFIGEAMQLTPRRPAVHSGAAVSLLRHGAGQSCVHHAWAAMVYPGEGFDPLATLQTVADERCTALHGVPTMFIAQLEHADFAKFDLSSLRTGIMAGAPCPIEVMRRCIRDMHLSEITIAYGMTETSPVSTQTTTDDPLERRVTTVGRVQPHIEVKIVDAEGRVVPRGVPGEFCTRGYSVMLGYWNDKERTDAGDRCATLDAHR